VDVEAALARALADAGVIPANAIASIQAECRADRYDVKEIARASAVAGNPVIPLVKALTAAVARRDAAAAGFIHWGATSQDVMDTALVLQLRAALDLIDADLTALADATAHLADKHRRTVLAGRTSLQQAIAFTI